MAIHEARLPDHPRTARCHTSLGIVLRELGELPEAHGHLERALAIYEARLRPDHPHTAHALCNLANVMRELGELPSARAHYQWALSIYEASLGHDHHLTVITGRELVAVRATIDDAARQV
jgi:tetratricopeptide (TPR) repeat protein